VPRDAGKILSGMVARFHAGFHAGHSKGNTMKTKQFQFQITTQLWQAIDAARGDQPRCGWLEAQLWRMKSIKDGAEASGVENPKRPVERRGGNRKVR